MAVSLVGTKEHWDIEVIFTSVLDPIDFFFEASFFIFIA